VIDGGSTVTVQGGDLVWGGKMKSLNQAPNLTHANAATICEMALKAMGQRTDRAVDYRDGCDFLVGDDVRIAVRYAIPTSDRQQVYKKRNGELSHYTYKRWTFNFHRHGKIDSRYCDFFVCFLASANGSGKARSDVTVFVIPWEAITGLTFCSSMREGSLRPYRGKYAVYQDAWHLIEEATGAGVSPGERKLLKISADSRRRLKLVTGVDESDDGQSVVTPSPVAAPKEVPVQSEQPRPALFQRTTVRGD
jgi:hypothetical protein